MSVASEINALTQNVSALNGARSDIRTALSEKGVTADTHNFSDFADDVRSIQSGPETKDIVITNYDTTNGYIYGTNFGTSAGTVWLLDRDTHTYSSLSISSWGDTYITLSSPINRSTIQGNTCFYVKTAEGKCSTKYMVYGDGTLTVPTYGLVYVKSAKTGVVTKYTLSSDTQVKNLRGSSSSYSKNLTVGNATIYSDEVVGVQFGDGITQFTVGTYYLASMPSLNQPVVFPSTVSFGSSSSNTLAYDLQLDCPVIFNNTSMRVGSNFMTGCSSFNQPLNISTAIAIGNYFMQGCTSFNQEIVFPSITSLGTYFMRYCSSFNRPLPLISSLTSIGIHFLEGCSSFNQSIDISGISSVPNYFMNDCVSMNSPIKLKTGESISVGTYFLKGCSSFNQSIDISKVATIPNYFMNDCISMNSPIKLDEDDTMTIGTYFLKGCKNFNQPVNISNSVTSIGAYFLNGCTNFNQSINISSSMSSITLHFMSGCNSYSKGLTIPSTITNVSDGFMYNIYNSNVFVVNCSVYPTDSYSLSTNDDVGYVGSYNQGHFIKGTYKNTWIDNIPALDGEPVDDVILYRYLADGD